MKLPMARVSQNDLIEIHVNKVTQGVYVAPADGVLQYEMKEEAPSAKETQE